MFKESRIASFFNCLHCNNINEEIRTEIKSFLGDHQYHYSESAVTTLISRELSEGQWHQVLTFESDTSIDINLELV